MSNHFDHFKHPFPHLQNDGNSNSLIRLYHVSQELGQPSCCAASHVSWYVRLVALSVQHSLPPLL